MSKYLEILKNSFYSEYIYRANIFFTILRNILYLFISISIWKALYGANTVVGNISINEILNYIIITFFIKTLTRSDIADNITNRIKNGLIIMDLIRPISLKLSNIFEQIGKNIFSLLFSSVPTFIIAFFIFNFKFTFSYSIIIFIFSAVFGCILMFLISYTLSLLAFWFKSAVFVRFLLRALLDIFSGAVIPLWFYPKMLYQISMFLPFRLIYFSPISIFLGKYSFFDSISVIFYQIIWIFIFIIIEKIIWLNAQKSITVHGG